nr:hypothetical protein [Acinetobacter larvae]
MALVRGYGIVSPLWVGAALSLVALVVVILGSIFNVGLKAADFERN